MKKVFLFLATCCITMGAMAQIQVKSDGNVYTNAKSVFINKQDSISGAISCMLIQATFLKLPMRQI